MTILRIIDGEGKTLEKDIKEFSSAFLIQLYSTLMKTNIDGRWNKAIEGIAEELDERAKAL